MSTPITVDDLVQLVRDDLDEANVVDVSQSLILRKLNRAQRTAVNKVVPKFGELLNASIDVTTEGEALFDKPYNCYGLRIKHINLVENGVERPPLNKITSRDIPRYNRPSATSRPTAWLMKHNRFQVLPTPEAGLTLRVHYNRLPETLVLSQGRITGYGTDASTSLPYITLDAVGSDLTTENTLLYNYVNVIDHRSGEVRGTLQIASIDRENGRVFFKTSGLGRDTVLGKTVSTDLPSTLSVDDYICVVHGTCVPEIPEAYLDYLVQHAVVTVKRAKQEPTQEDYADLKDQETDMKNMWTGREGTLRISKQNDRYFIRRF